MFGHFPNRAIAVHESGLTALLQKKGPPDVNDPMELQVIMDCHLSIVRLTTLFNCTQHTKADRLSDPKCRVQKRILLSRLQRMGQCT